MALYTGPEHVITLVNPTWEHTVGKPGAVGRRFRDVFPEFRESGLFELLDRVYETGEPYVNPEVNVPLDRWSTGVLEDSWWSLVWRPLAGEGPGGRDILVHAVDVTQQVHARKEVEQKAEELARLAAALEASNRELDQFAYVTSHDLKAPLRGIANLSRWLEEDLGERVTTEARGHLDLLRGRVHRMESLIDAILEYSRVGRKKGKVETVETRRLLDEVVDLLAPPAGFRLEAPAEMPVVKTERARLQQVLMNLIGNAVKHHPDREKCVVQIGVEDAGDRWRFSVSDNGRGIPRRFHDKVFVIFQTLEARDKVEGTGIGLAIVKKVVESKGGRVELDSDEGRGATFRFTWPKEETGGE